LHGAAWIVEMFQAMVADYSVKGISGERESCRITLNERSGLVVRRQINAYGPEWK
jgi:hypothetical protein